MADPTPTPAYPEGLYTPEAELPALPDAGAFDAAAVARYRADGCLAIARLFDPERVHAALDAIDGLARGAVPDYRGVQREGDGGALSPGEPGASLDRVRKLWSFVPHSDVLRGMCEDVALLHIVEILLGARARMFQDMALLKPPGGGREKPWHQDKAYFNYALGTPVVGVWIALDEALIENGCMHVIPGTHREGPVIHFKRRDWQICDTDMLGRTCTAVPLPPGGALFFDGLLQHGTPDNHSQRRRRALQFHYLPVDAEGVSEADRLEVFGSEGRDVTC